MCARAKLIIKYTFFQTPVVNSTSVYAKDYEFSKIFKEYTARNGKYQHFAKWNIILSTKVQDFDSFRI